MTKILLIDDEKNILKAVGSNLEQNGFNVDAAISAEIAFTKLDNKKYDVILCDLILTGMNGLDFLSRVRKINKDVIFIMITANGFIDDAVKAMKIGADDFISKPIDMDGLINNINILLSKKENYNNYNDENKPKFKTNLIYKSKIIEDLIKEIGMIAKASSNVLITGETGTGKELIARIIHEISERKGAFIGININAYPDSLIENELFGHEKGSFTNAVSTQKGKFELASNGTLFLDEIGEMPIAVQSKLLRILQEREFSMIGSNSVIKLTARIVSATNIDIENAVLQNKFREDLFYRINVFHLKVPPLRERKDDIMPLVYYFIKKFNAENKKNIVNISKDVEEILINYNFPGNVRELENIIERSVIVTPFDSIEVDNLPNYLKKTDKTPPISFMPLNNHCDYDLNLDSVEKELIIKALEKYNYNQTKTAISLGISRKQLRTKMKKYGLFSEK
ncbi:MAG: sigma-54-dependent Fis family transcriptional regulator [Candidatus Acididesulfobacter diazotrophicus]|jgi:DNA-binding NtrC family response regulator|uniref:Sigma-54-dependent Fis family transcriptional regulator n=1 Tax=Candidatus Acididesulfobacter diazotrophicus TaxID=2597226 RepID=A0A519BK85_9DELT|nr:MAG: sigma-54-dependent Fis family transcriptional regulator [Candidatus Acididesulfobacter diazotrophicus]